MLNPLFVVSLVSTTSTRRVRHQIMTGQINKMGTVSSSFFHEGNPSKYVKVSWLEVPEFSIGLSKKRGTWLTRQSKHELSTKSGRSHCKLFDRQSWSRLRGATDGRNGARRDLTPMWCISFVIVPLTSYLYPFDIIWYHLIPLANS